MSDPASRASTAFKGHELLLSGPLADVALAVKKAAKNSSSEAILVFDDATGRVIDLDLRGTKAEIIERLGHIPTTFGRHSQGDSSHAEEEAQRGRGRPKLGVVPREVTLLPRHWEWLSAQPEGASAVLRRLVDAARHSDGTQRKRRAAQEAAYRFMHALAGDFPDYEEATRALFADDRPKLEQRLADWPKDIRTHVLRLAFDHTVT